MYLSNVTTSRGKKYAYSNTQEAPIQEKKWINTKADAKETDTKEGKTS